MDNERALRRDGFEGHIADSRNREDIADEEHKLASLAIHNTISISIIARNFLFWRLQTSLAKSVLCCVYCPTVVESLLSIIRLYAPSGVTYTSPTIQKLENKFYLNISLVSK